AAADSAVTGDRHPHRVGTVDDGATTGKHRGASGQQLSARGRHSADQSRNRAGVSRTGGVRVVPYVWQNSKLPASAGPSHRAGAYQRIRLTGHRQPYSPRGNHGPNPSTEDFQEDPYPWPSRSNCSVWARSVNPSTG